MQSIALQTKSSILKAFLLKSKILNFLHKIFLNLGWKDSNLWIADSNSDALPLGHIPQRIDKKIKKKRSNFKIESMKSFCKAKLCTKIEKMKSSMLLKSKILFAKLCFALRVLQRSLKSLILTRRLLKSKILFAKLCFALRIFSAK